MLDLPALVHAHRIIAILRGVPLQHAVRLTEHLHRAGIRLLEVALSDRHGLDVLRELDRQFGPELVLGAGTVITPELAAQAQAAGARFLLTPHVVPEVNAYAVQHGLGLISGAMTPTEIQQALAQGSRPVKLFPAGDLGPGYLRSLLGPYPDLQVVVVGNITTANLPEFVRAGAVGAGIGSHLTHTDWNAPDFATLEHRARTLLAQFGSPEDRA
ncbi:bifunctional 4-hydroxy-2-oxoglutarate aldolase/2-dehydro-3-deoxy-phosphogluconate aldolase [Deinococcus sonorensis]|uniref:Bifunctional 4-hydroxy-2-oxoglutarate aldolase/2-dehydro-3-deoxy-phosphogluconate aldolase n=2 Tax=Deinococcus sonorensis TaxID=309891 RepID=A0AAU7UFT0_9DEIO